MKRLYPRRVRNKLFLSQLLELYLHHLSVSPMQVSLKTLAYNSAIPASIINRMMQLHRNPDDEANISTEDYHIVFSNIMFHYPTIKIWLQEDGLLFFEM